MKTGHRRIKPPPPKIATTEPKPGGKRSPDQAGGQAGDKPPKIKPQGRPPSHSTAAGDHSRQAGGRATGQPQEITATRQGDKPRPSSRRRSPHQPGHQEQISPRRSQTEPKRKPQQTHRTPEPSTQPADTPAPDNTPPSLQADITQAHRCGNFAHTHAKSPHPGASRFCGGGEQLLRVRKRKSFVGIGQKIALPAGEGEKERGIKKKKQEKRLEHKGFEVERERKIFFGS